jgi:hypothetical protein
MIDHLVGTVAFGCGDFLGTRTSFWVFVPGTIVGEEWARV